METVAKIRELVCEVAKVTSELESAQSEKFNVDGLLFQASAEYASAKGRFIYAVLGNMPFDSQKAKMRAEWQRQQRHKLHSDQLASYIESKRAELKELVDQRDSLVDLLLTEVLNES